MVFRVVEQNKGGIMATCDTLFFKGPARSEQNNKGNRERRKRGMTRNPLTELMGLFVFFLVSKVTHKQEVELSQTQAPIETNDNFLSSNTDSMWSPETTLQDESKDFKSLSNRFPLNKNNFLPQNLIKEVTAIID